MLKQINLIKMSLESNYSGSDESQYNSGLDEPMAVDEDPPPPNESPYTSLTVQIFIALVDRRSVGFIAIFSTLVCLMGGYYENSNFPLTETIAQAFICFIKYSKTLYQNRFLTDLC